MSTGCFSWCPLLTRWGFKKPIAENLKSDEVSVDSCRSNSLIHKCIQKLPFLGFHLPSTTTNESSRLVGGPCFPPTTTSPPLDYQPPPLENQPPPLDNQPPPLEHHLSTTNHHYQPPTTPLLPLPTTNESSRLVGGSSSSYHHLTKASTCPPPPPTSHDDSLAVSLALPPPHQR